MKMDDIEELTDVEVEALKSLGPIFHYFGAWKPYLINARAKNGLFFGDYWTIEETGQDIMYLGDELLFKRLPIKNMKPCQKAEVKEKENGKSDDHSRSF